MIRCQHCEDTRQYLDKGCFLAPLSAAGSSDKSGGTVAVAAGLIAAIKLARVESIELQKREYCAALISDEVERFTLMSNMEQTQFCKLSNFL